MLTKIDFFPGIIIHSNIDIDPNIPLENQVESLKEDLFQVNYADKYLIDIGWYPSFSIEGCFKVMIIKDFDWFNPVKEKETRDIEELISVVKEYVKFVRKVLL